MASVVESVSNEKDIAERDVNNTTVLPSYHTPDSPTEKQNQEEERDTLQEENEEKPVTFYRRFRPWIQYVFRILCFTTCPAMRHKSDAGNFFFLPLTLA